MKKVILILALINLTGCYMAKEPAPKTPERLIYEDINNLCGESHWGIRKNELDYVKMEVENSIRERYKNTCMRALLKTDSAIEADTRCTMFAYDYASAFVSYCAATGYMDKKQDKKISDEAIERSMR